MFMHISTTVNFFSVSVLYINIIILIVIVIVNICREHKSTV